MAKKTEKKTELTPEQEEMVKMHQLVGTIMTKNVNLSKDEYNKMLEQIGLNFEGEDKATPEERLERIRANFYGTMLNLFFTTHSMINSLTAEVECWRALLKAICEHLGIDVDEIKTSTDRVNEVAEKLIREQLNKKK